MATNYVKASYTEVIDLQTTNGNTSIIGIHTPVGSTPFNRLQGFWNQFRKFRYKGISSLMMVPAANLPVDPLGLTGVVGTTDLMDPRDNLNPILFHGAHGTALNTILDSIYSADEYVGSGITNVSSSGRNVSSSASEQIVSNASDTGSYYRCLTDTSWRKFGIQSGVRLRGLHPLVHKLARNMPLLPSLVSAPNATKVMNYNAGLLTGLSSDTEGIVNDYPPQVGAPDAEAAQVPMSSGANVYTYDSDGLPGYGSAYVQEMTNGMARLGWMPTASMVQNSQSTDQIAPTILPKLYMGVLVLPPAYNVEQYFRMVIRHEFEFSDFTTSLGIMGIGARNYPQNRTDSVYYNWIDYTNATKEDLDKIAAIDGVDSPGSTIDMIGGSSTVVSHGVS